MKGLSTSFGCSLTKLHGAAAGWPIYRSWTIGNTRCLPWLHQSRLSAAQAVKDAPKDGNRASAGRRSRPTSGDKLVSSPRSPRPSRPEGKQPLRQRPPSQHADQAPVQHFSPVRVAQETELESAGPALEAKVVKDAPKDGNRASAGRRSRPTSGDKSAPSPRRRRSSRPRAKQPLKQRPQLQHTDQAPVQHSSPVHVGQEIELECARLALEGKGVCLLPPTGYVVLVERTLPGERVLVEVVSVKRGYAEARKLASLSPHRHAVPPPCSYFGPCGGCTLQCLQYDAQLEEKRNQVEQTLRRVGRLGPALDHLAVQAEVKDGQVGGAGVAPAVGCREPFAYRNKMMFHWSARCWLPPDTVVEDRPCLGLLRPSTADVVLPVVQHGCKLQGNRANDLMTRVEELVRENDLLPYNHSSGKGSLKHLVIRSGSSTPQASSSNAAMSGELMALFGVTRGSAVEALRPLAEALGRDFPDLVSVAVQVVAPPLPSSRGGSGSVGAAGGRGRGSRSETGRQSPPPPTADDDGNNDTLGEDDSKGGDVMLLYGRPYIQDVIGGLTFRISPESFFQTNTRQAEELYAILRQASGLRPGAVDTVLDLYCGTGTIALLLAKGCRQVVGVEVQESAVEDARRNAALNNITNVSFICADVNMLQRTLVPTTTTISPTTGTSAASPAEPLVPAPDVVVVDPARGGLSLDAAAFLSRCGARRVVYVSCNAATQARDLNRLCNGLSAPFSLVSVTPVDMFPHTDHMEVVAVLDRREQQAVGEATLA